MRVLIGCEFSGTVRDLFLEAGHDAWSSDLLPTESLGPHHQGDVRDILGDGWDLMIAHPPCTYLTVSGIHWCTYKPGHKTHGNQQKALERTAKIAEALEFFKILLDAPIPHICIENPVGITSTRIRKPDQIIQPWYFGDDASKKTGLWLKNLPKLIHTNVLPGDNKTRRANQTPSGQNKLGPSPDRWKLRSLTYPGIAAAMVSQWQNLEK